MLRASLDKLTAIFASPEECSGMINTLITSKDMTQIETIGLIAQKMGCPFDAAAISKMIQDTPAQKEPEKHPVSVFAFTGWLLFILSFFLKLHYMHSSHKHKKIAKDALSSR